MERLLKKMLPAGAPPLAIDSVDYSFAIEYHGPPVPYEIPEAIPIEFERIPVAAVAAPPELPNPLSLPVVPPLPSPGPLKKPSKSRPLAVDPAGASPTSVIENHTAMDRLDSVEVSGEVGSSGALGSAGFPDRSVELSDGMIDSSGAVGFKEVEGFDGSSEGTDSSGVLGFSGEVKEGEGFEGSLDGPESSRVVAFSSEFKKCEGLDGSPDNTVPGRVLTESALSSDFEFRSSDSGDDEALDTEAKRAVLVTFQDSARSSGPASPAIGLTLRGRRLKKEACYQCLIGSRFTEKEACMACDAKYCSGCVLWAMGSMPEGRKCVSCIGSSIMETKREKLGKPSRMLKRLLSSLEVQLVMRSEKDCEANQLRPENICVNEEKLTQEEMVLLQNCPCPPSKLKPGSYWYDKVLGFWGKQGHKPHEIISPLLNVGGRIKKNASNGNTGVLINEREITKAELRMLKWAGVQCAGNPHFWVSADGTYQEEGQKKIIGQIWGKPILKLLCPVFSLPIPSNPANLSGEEVNNMVNRAVPDYLEQKTLQRLLLVGNQGSGTSTIFKQAKFLYRSVPFSEDERQDVKLVIQSNIYAYLGILLEGREWFEEESLTDKRKGKQLHCSGTRNNGSNEHDMTEYYIGPPLKAFSDWLLKVMASGNVEDIFPAAARVYAPLVEQLWNDAAIQATYKRRNELPLLPLVASYFLERVVDICRVEYEPSNMDILYADGIMSCNGLACTDFFFPCMAGDGNGNDDDDKHDTLLIRYQLIRLNTKGLGENCKWLDMFEDVRLVIFCVALSDYDEYFEDANGVAINKMMESKRLFEGIVGHPALDQRDFLLILNKIDLLDQKIDMAPLTLCKWFDDFNPVVSRHRPHNSDSHNINNNGATMVQLAFHYIAVKFKKLFYYLTGRKLYVTLANGLDSDSVDAALRYAREILKWEDEGPVFRSGETFCSTEPSTYSP